MTHRSIDRPIANFRGMLTALFASAVALPSTAFSAGTELVDINVFGQPGVGCQSGSPLISGDGQFVAFNSTCGQIVVGITAGSTRVYLRDMTLGSTILVSRTATGGVPASDNAKVGSISEDGRFVLFESTAQLTAGAPAPGTRAAYLFDRGSGSVDLVSIGAYGTAHSGFVQHNVAPSMTPDGRYVLFHSTEFLTLDAGWGSWYRLYRRDRVAQQTTLISYFPHNSPSAGAS